jgi:hydrogenase-4 component B
MDMLLFAIVLQVAGGTVAILLSRFPRVATVVGAGATALGCLLAATPAVRVLLGGPAEMLRLSWDEAHGAFCVGVDPLSAFFLLPLSGLSAVAAVYGGDYLLAYRKEKSLGIPWFFFNVFAGGMTMVLVARTALLFLVAWEVMSLSAWCLVTFEHEKPEVRRAGWIYLVATHLGVIFLFVAFTLLGREARGLEFRDFQAMAIGSSAAGLVFVLSLVGFGAKAGLFPFHVWLPEAHPAAPSHVSALMSGVMIKMGLYGMLRMLTFLGSRGPWWGPTLAAAGLLTGLIGIAMAGQQRDVKRVLAFSSIENMGLIVFALGVSLWGEANHLPLVAVLSMAGALLHIWNHALMKGLMFLAAGSVLHATGTRDMEQLGGLMQRMPWTGTLMLLGAVAIAALPPLNGFVSKWLMYLGLLDYGLAAGGSRGLAAFLSVGLVALIGGLAVFTFVRLTGIVLLGGPRSESASHAHESSPWMIGPMLILLLACVAMAVLPQRAVGVMSAVAGQLLGEEAGKALPAALATDAPLSALGGINAWGSAAMLLGICFLWHLTRRASVTASQTAGPTAGPTWGCGYVRPTPRMQYTGQSFAAMLSGQLLPRFLRPKTVLRPPRGLFPAAGEFTSTSPDFFTERVYQPLFARWATRCTQLRILQQGKIHVYLFYIMFMVVLALSWVSLRAWWRT